MSEPTLTARELDTLRRIAEGLTYPEICRALFIEIGTVKFHAGNIRKKLGANTLAHAVAIAYQRGLLGNETDA